MNFAYFDAGFLAGAAARTVDFAAGLFAFGLVLGLLLVFIVTGSCRSIYKSAAPVLARSRITGQLLSHGTRGPAGRLAEPLDQGLGAIQDGQPVLNVLEPGEIRFAGLGAQRAFGFFQLSR